MSIVIWFDHVSFCISLPHSFIVAVGLDNFRHTLGIGRNQLSQEGPSKKVWEYLVYSGYASFQGDANKLFDDEGLAALGEFTCRVSAWYCI